MGSAGTCPASMPSWSVRPSNRPMPRSVPMTQPYPQATAPQYPSQPLAVEQGPGADGAVPFLAQQTGDQPADRSMVLEHEHHLSPWRGLGPPIVLAAREGMGHGREYSRPLEHATLCASCHLSRVRLQPWLWPVPTAAQRYKTNRCAARAAVVPSIPRMGSRSCCPAACLAIPSSASMPYTRPLRTNTTTCFRATLPSTTSILDVPLDEKR